MGGPLYNIRYVYEGIKQIGKDLLTYPVTLFIALFSPVWGGLSDQK